MGYVRQSAAIGFILLALVHFERGSFGHFAKWMVLATLFHVSAICVLPLAVFALVRKHPWWFVPLAGVGTLLYVYLLAPRLDRFYENYVEAEYDSSGAAIRLAMNAIPAVLFLIYRKRFPVSDNGKAIWTLISVLALGLVALVVISPATTAIDRVGLSGLFGIAQSDAERRSVAQKVAEPGQVRRRGDHQDVAYARKHQHAEGIVDHRLVEDRQHLFGNGEGGGVQARAASPGKDDPLHRHSRMLQKWRAAIDPTPRALGLVHGGAQAAVRRSDRRGGPDSRQRLPDARVSG